MTPTAERIAYPHSGHPSQMDRRAWDKGLKTTDSLRTLQASNVEKSTIESRKETRGLMTRDGAPENANTPLRKRTPAPSTRCSTAEPARPANKLKPVNDLPLGASAKKGERRDLRGEPITNISSSPFEA